MKRFYCGILLFFVLILLFPFTVNAQYEQKLTLQAAIGTAFIVSNNGLKQHIPDHYFGTDPFPDMHEVTEEIYGLGSTFNGGIQYNLSRKFSILGLIMYDGYPTKSRYIKNGYEYLGLYVHLGVGVSGKYKFFSHKKFKPYLLAGFSLSYTLQQVDELIFNESLGGRERVREFKDSHNAVPSFVSGVGAEYDITDRFTMFLQLGNSSYLTGKESNIPSTQLIYSVLGVNLNIFKSKSL